MSSTTDATHPLLGAYAMAPGDPNEATAFYRALAELPIGGLEIPAPATDLEADDVALIAARLQPGWRVMLTAIPVVMGRLGSDPDYGLASTDDEARARALADVARALDLAHRLADLAGKRRVTAIEVHSAPGPVLGDASSLSLSLETIAGWDLAGTQILIEHCDALVGGQRAAKGFLTLGDEIESIRAAGSPDPIGIGINWGRSAIEGRSAHTPIDHLATASDAGLLRALVFSGASAQESAWGDAWGDAHIPSRGDDAALSASSGSLLDTAAIAKALEAAGARTDLAVKVSVRPRDLTIDQRVAVARAVLTQLEAHRGS